MPEEINIKLTHTEHGPNTEFGITSIEELAECICDIDAEGKFKGTGTIVTSDICS